MTKSLFLLMAQSALVIPSFAILVANPGSLASEPLVKAIDQVDVKEISVAVEGQKVCAKHPSVAKFFCTDLEQILKLKKGVAMIDALDSKDALLQVTDAESDAAIAMFGCDCVVSINRLRHVRNALS